MKRNLQTRLLKQYKNEILEEERIPKRVYCLECKKELPTVYGIVSALYRLDKKSNCVGFVCDECHEKNFPKKTINKE